jgi:uncharacterized cupredoxin-like copper-binding protein
MRKTFTLVVALALVVAACGEDDASAGDTTATTAAAEVHEEEVHEEGDEHSEEAHEEEVHEEGDEHSEEAHEEESHDEMGGMPDGMFASVESFPEALGEATTEYVVTMTEFGFEPAVLDLEPGETVRFTIVNAGMLGHEFRLTTEHKTEEHIASGHEDHGAEAGGEHHADADIIVNVAPGETRTVEMTLPEDQTAIDHMSCLIPGHYEGGMFGSVQY